MSKWSDEQARQIGQAVKALRGKRTGQWLADRTAELGHPISRTTISELESDDGRRRHVTTAELIVLAAALNTAPVALLYPGPDYNELISVLPGVEDRKIEAVQWFSGIRPSGYGYPTEVAGEAGELGREIARLRTEYREHTNELRLWRELLDVYRRISSVTVPTRRVDGELVPGKLNDVQLAQLEAWNDQVHSLRSRLGLVDDSDLVDGG